jgi:hypothetical protein
MNNVTTTQKGKTPSGNEFTKCMAIFCPEEKRNTCHYHIEWQKTLQQVGVYFGDRNCEYYLSVKK